MADDKTPTPGSNAPPNDYPKMPSTEIEIDHPTMGKIKRRVALRYKRGHALSGQTVVFANKKEEDAFGKEGATEPDVPSAEPPVGAVLK